MVYRTPPPDAALDAELAALDDLRRQLGLQAGAAGLWLGSLRRQWRASSAESSIEIEGFHVPKEARMAVAGGVEPSDPNNEDRMALYCYAQAMDHVGVMSVDPAFEWVERVVLDLHFDACYFQKDRSPGLYRTHGIEVTSPDGGLLLRMWRCLCARSCCGSPRMILMNTSSSVRRWPICT
jgi:hypothetical protein